MRKPTPPTPHDRRRPGREPRFSRDELARQALAILDTQGPEGLTMRALASELGMGTMALYRYFPSKRELMDAAVEIAARQIELPDLAAADWKQQLGSLARALFNAGLRHPSVARERFGRPLANPAAMQVTDAAVALLLRAGLSNGDAVAAFKALLLFTLGTAAAAASESRSEVREHARSTHAVVPAAEFPAMASLADEFTAALGGDQAFELGLAALLDGIELRTRHK